MRLLRLLAAGGLAALLLSGCAGYRLGPTNGRVAGGKSIAIRPFSNHTLMPRLGDAVTTALRQSLQRDGTYHLATHGGGDIVVSGVIQRYDRQEVSFLSGDVLTVRDYRVVAHARVIARDTATGKVLLDQPVTGYTLVAVGSDLANAERQGLPLLAQNLARHVTALLVDGSW